MTKIDGVLVTGGCGFVGANLVRFLRRHTEWSVRVLDDLRTGKESYLEAGLAEVIVGDVADEAIVEAAVGGMDAVVHLASQTGVLPSVEDPIRDFRGNPLPTITLLETCRRLGVDRIVFASSGAVLGDVTPPLHEDLVPQPLSPYGAGKLTGEAYCSAYAGSFGMSTASLRFSNVFGPYSQHKQASAVPNFIMRSLMNEPIVIFGDGSQTRDFINVDDLCSGILQCLLAEGIAGEVFQLATGVETSIAELATIVQRATGSSAGIRFQERRKGEVYKSRVNISKARELLGFEPGIALAQGIAGTATWYREHWLPGGRLAR